MKRTPALRYGVLVYLRDETGKGVIAGMKCFNIYGAQAFDRRIRCDAAAEGKHVSAVIAGIRIHQHTRLSADVFRRMFANPIVFTD